MFKIKINKRSEQLYKASMWMHADMKSQLTVCSTILWHWKNAQVYEDLVHCDERVNNCALML